MLLRLVDGGKEKERVWEISLQISCAKEVEVLTEGWGPSIGTRLIEPFDGKRLSTPGLAQGRVVVHELAMRAFCVEQ